MRPDFIPLSGQPSTPEHRAKHCAGSDYRCFHCWSSRPGAFQCYTDSEFRDVTDDATGYPLRLAECEEVEDG